MDTEKYGTEKQLNKLEVELYRLYNLAGIPLTEGQVERYEYLVNKYEYQVNNNKEEDKTE